MMSAYKILLIEDDPAVTKSPRAGLTREGFMVTGASTGSEGLDHAHRSSPHLILLDIRLPDRSGFDFCRQMRQIGLHQPIIILTVQHDEFDKVLGPELGADDYVTKPFGLRELVSRIRAQLRRAYGDYASADSGAILVADLVLDAAKGQVRRGDEVIDLTPLEFRLLSHLARHRGQALTRAQIVEAVWGFVADLPQLFHRFHRGRNTNAYPGSGLGLAVVKAIAAARGGGIDVQSAGEGKGSQFSFRLPTVPSQKR